MTDEESYKNTKEWLNEINEHTEEGIVIMLIGNKLDLIQENPSLRKIKSEEVRSFCKDLNLLYNETSAKTGDNIKESFEELIESNSFYKNSISKIEIYQQSLKNPAQNEILQEQNKIVLVSDIGGIKKDDKPQMNNINQNKNNDCCK